MQIRLIVSLLLLTFTISAGAQKPLVPGKKSFEQKWVRDTHYTMTWFAVADTMRREIGKVEVQIAKTGSLLTAITEVKLKGMPAKWIDSTVADLKTLKPVYHSSYNMQRNMVLHFGKVVTGFYDNKINHQYTPIADTTTSAYFDSNLYPLLLGWLSLSEDFKQEISIYDYNPAGKTGVLKAAVIDVKTGVYDSQKSGSRTVWVVTPSDEIGNGENGVSTYYFDKEDRSLWKQEIITGERKFVMQRIE
jgi:hypothetical protein